MLARGGPVEREAPRPARFAVGDRVRTRVINPRGHTRLPRYARGRAGVVERVHGCHVFPDSNAHGRGEDPQWLYSVLPRRRGLLRRVRALPGAGVTFDEPWEAQAFALAVTLQDRGVFTEAEWSEALGAEIAAAPDAPYYRCWLAALERLVERR